MARSDLTLDEQLVAFLDRWETERVKLAEKYRLRAERAKSGAQPGWRLVYDSDRRTQVHYTHELEMLRELRRRACKPQPIELPIVEPAKGTHEAALRWIVSHCRNEAAELARQGYSFARHFDEAAALLEGLLGDAARIDRQELARDLAGATLPDEAESDLPFPYYGA